MSSGPTRRYRIARFGLLLTGFLPALACTAGVPAPIDLLTTLPSAERRAVGDVATDVRAAWVDRQGDRRLALIMRAPARVTWDLRLPARARLRAAIAPADADAPSGVTARVAIVGGRVYEGLLSIPVQVQPSGSAWTPIDVDLSAYSGWRLSLFYHPSRMLWRVQFSADATPGGQIAWAQPAIEFQR
jgi:hypothetical protein